MEQQHTQEPWRANDAQADIDGPNGEPVAVCYCNDDKGDDAIANARRIVACVNACAGISTELLEECKTLSYSAYNMIRDVEKQRDELLAALENVADNVCERMIEIGRVVEGVDFHALHVGIRKTIASAKGGAA